MSLRVFYRYWSNYLEKKNYFAPILILFFINHKQTNEGITIMVVKTKNVPQSPFNQSTKAPEDEASVVLPAVPIEASNAYWVAVYVLSTNKDMKATKATVAKAAVISSAITAIANKISDFPVHAKIANKRFVTAIKPPAKNMVFIVPALIAIMPPNKVNTTVVIQPSPFE